GRHPPVGGVVVTEKFRGDGDRPGVVDARRRGERGDPVDLDGRRGGGRVPDLRPSEVAEAGEETSSASSAQFGDRADGPTYVAPVPSVTSRCPSLRRQISIPSLAASASRVPSWLNESIPGGLLVGGMVSKEAPPSTATAATCKRP